MSRTPIAAAVFAGLVLSTALSGCTLGELVPGTAPDGWAEFQPCEESSAWVWVPGFPTEQIEAAGLEPECGGTYFEDGLAPYTSVADLSVSEDQLADLGAALEAAGYEKTADTFEPVTPGAEQGLVGSFKYERDADDPAKKVQVFIISYWAGTEPVDYQTYIDFESPGTRDLTED